MASQYERSASTKTSVAGRNGRKGQSTNPFTSLGATIIRTFGTTDNRPSSERSEVNNNDLKLDDAEAALLASIETRDRSHSANNPRLLFAESRPQNRSTPRMILRNLSGDSGLSSEGRRNSLATHWEEPSSPDYRPQRSVSPPEVLSSSSSRFEFNGENTPLFASSRAPRHRSGSSGAKGVRQSGDVSPPDETCWNPLHCIRFLVLGVLCSTVPVALVFFAVAWILYFYCDNPSAELLNIPKATLSWWFNFVGRQLIVLEFSRFCQYILIDCVVNSTRLKRRIGAWVRLILSQAHGYPFVLSLWALFDLILMQGDGIFQMNWFFFTGIGLYSSENPGNYVLDSDWYLRTLFCMITIGCATTIKQVWLKTAFGRQHVATYKSDLEDLLNEIIILSDIAELAVEAEMGYSSGASTDKVDPLKRPALSKIRWKSLRFSDADTSDDESAGENEDGDDGIPGTHSHLSGSFLLKRQVSGIRNQLDRWEEPIDKSYETRSISMDDILKFEQAVAYMNQDYPFSENFGKVTTRDELIVAAESLYKRLLMLVPGSKLLPFCTLERVTADDDGSEDQEKKALLKHLFRANVRGDLTIISFVQSCDFVYRRLRYFRASVGNAKVIDKQAEIIINAGFRFLLFLFIISMLKFNPWTLLVSMSTLLVTASFAVGPSCAKGIEGILLIVGRRPYDIGDRIVIAANPSDDNKAVSASWYVEDISLFNTTLRFALTGEVATISNGTITQARITNLNRSRVSNIVLDIPYHISLHDKDNLQLYTGKVQQYIDSYPNIYDGINCFQCEAIDTNLESVTYRLSVRCRVSWQNAKRVFVHRSNLHRQCIAIAHEMKVDYTTPDPQNIMYYGGSLPDGTTVNGSIAKKGGDFVEVMNLPREIGTARNDVLGS